MRGSRRRARLPAAICRCTVFETLTLAPFDRRPRRTRFFGLDRWETRLARRLSCPRGVETVGPHLDADERSWLEKLGRAARTSWRITMSTKGRAARGTSGIIPTPERHEAGHQQRRQFRQAALVRRLAPPSVVRHRRPAPHLRPAWTRGMDGPEARQDDVPVRPRCRHRSGRRPARMIQRV